MNLARLLERSARAFPALPALARGRTAVASYAELADRVARLAGGLRDRLGLAPGDRVALFMKNGPAYAEALLACWHAGLVAVPVNAKLHPRELQYILENCAARACFVAGAGAVLAPPETRVVDVESRDYEALFADPSPIAEVSPGDLAWLFYTSGTTGRPKGVMLTHANLLAMTHCYFSDVDTIAPGEAILHAAPMSHGSGLYLLPHLAKAAVQVVPESGGFDPAEIFELIVRWRGATLFAAPTMVKRLVDFPRETDLANLKTIVYGGGPMYLAAAKRALERFGDRLAQIYGQGESPMTITALSKAMHAERSHPRWEARLASVGLPHTGIEVRIADAEDRPLPEQQVGEVLVRGATVMRGYWNNPEASAATLRGGWLHTGDLGSLDEEGFLTLKDRSKDLIISGGANIYPREIEEVLLRDPRVAEVSVVGAPDPEWGETVVAFVVARAESAIAPEELDRLCLAHIARFKRPRAYRFVAALPKNETGKVLKTELRRRLSEEAAKR